MNWEKREKSNHDEYTDDGSIDRGDEHFWRAVSGGREGGAGGDSRTEAGRWRGGWGGAGGEFDLCGHEDEQMFCGSFSGRGGEGFGDLDDEAAARCEIVVGG